MNPGKSQEKSCFKNRSFSITVSAQNNKTCFWVQSLFHRLNPGFPKKALLEGCRSIQDAPCFAFSRMEN
jgi:hypothetical protein